MQFGFQFYRVHSCSFFQHVVRERERETERADAIFDMVPLDEAFVRVRVRVRVGYA